MSQQAQESGEVSGTAGPGDVVDRLDDSEPQMHWDQGCPEKPGPPGFRRLFDPWHLSGDRPVSGFPQDPEVQHIGRPGSEECGQDDSACFIHAFSICDRVQRIPAKKPGFSAGEVSALSRQDSDLKARHWLVTAYVRDNMDTGSVKSRCVKTGSLSL